MITRCLQCGEEISIVGDPVEARSLFGAEVDTSHNCPKCGGPVQVLQESARVGTLCLNPYEAHLALSGFGFPWEQECNALKVQNLFSSVPVLRVDAVDIPGTTRSELRSITFKDGSRLYLAAGGKGVTVYRITRPGSHEDIGTVVQAAP
jgi:hypothetical protein